MKQEVMNLLINPPRTPEELFNKAFEFYRGSAGKNPQSERFLNAAGYTVANLQNLLYDLKQLQGITDAAVRMAKATPVKAEFELTLENIANTEMADIIEFLKRNAVELPKIPEFSKGVPGNLERKNFVEANNIEVSGNTNKLMDAAIKEFIDAEIMDLARVFVTPLEEEVKAAKEEEIAIEVTATTKEEVFTTAPDDVKEAVKLRDEFPFLDEVDCPEELYILVGKKMAHYHAYAKAHKALMVIVLEENEERTAVLQMTDKEIFALALSAVENFTVNQDIYAELAFYQVNKTILGIHPIFAERKAKSTVDLMSIPDATTRMNNLENYIRRETKKLGAKKTTDLEKEKINKKLAAWEFELALIKAKLGFSATK